MAVENTLARNIDHARMHAHLDNSCKKLLANKQILAWIMKSTMKEYGGYSVQTIAKKYIEGIPQIAVVPVHQDEDEQRYSESIRGIGNEDVSLTEGKVTYDIRFLAVVPKSGELVRMILNIEAQNDFYPGYPLIKRGIYYCGRMISSQNGTEFTGDHYEKIKKVYSIWICINPPKYRANTINEYSLEEKKLVGSAKEPVENYDLMAVIMICLGRQEDKKCTGILKLLGTLLSSELEPKAKKEILQKEFQIRMTRELESEVTQMCNYSKGVEENAMAASIRNLIETLHLSTEQAMDALKIPEVDKERYRRLLKNRD